MIIAANHAGWLPKVLKARYETKFLEIFGASGIQITVLFTNIPDYVFPHP